MKIRRTLTLMALILISVPLTACTKVGLFALNSTTGFNPHFTRHKNLSFGSHKKQKLDVYTPKNSNGRTPVVIFFYGGSWQSGSKNEYKFMGEALTSLGFTAVIADYRVYPEVKFPTFVEDAAKALRWTHDNIATFGGDTKQIYLMGHSAGAHIAALLAYDKKYLRAENLNANKSIQGFIGLAGPYDFLPFTDEAFKKIFAPENEYALSQPVNFIEGDEPRSLLMYGKKDKTVWPRNIENLSQKIKAKNGQVQTIYYDDLNHVSILTKFSRLLRRNFILSDVQNFILNKK